MFRIAGIILAAMLTLHAVGQENEGGERRSFRGPAGQGPKSGLREKRRPDMDQNAMLGKALRHPRMAEELGLSAEQRQVIDEQLAALEEAHIELRAKMEKAALKQARLMTEKELDEAALMAAVEETGRIHTEMAKLRIRHLLFMQQTLTPEQVEKARSIIRERMKRHHQERSGEDGRQRREGQWDQNRRLQRREQPETPPTEEPL
jgi:Spy/CpxP family protein refolding chaperone